MIKFFLLSFVALLAGIGIPIMAALNAGLGSRLASPVAATVVLFLVGLTISLIILFIIGLPEKPATLPSPQYFTGGAFVCFYVFSITIIAPRIGVGNAVLFVLLGQLLSLAVIDHFGLFGALKNELSVMRLSGLLLMATGIFFAR